MSNIKRPSFKYKIESVTTSNIHSDAIVHKTFIVYVKNNSFILNQWRFIDYENNANDDFSMIDSYIARCTSLEEAKDRLGTFIDNETKKFETITKNSVSIVDSGIINV